MHVKPDDNNNIVFSKGSSKGFIESTPRAGHLAPSSIVGVTTCLYVCTLYLNNDLRDDEPGFYMLVDGI